MANILLFVDPMMDRCEETAKKTGRSVLCWLKSVRLQSSYPKPFTLVRQSSTFAFRIYRADSPILRKTIDVQLRKKTLTSLDKIWQDDCWETVKDGCSTTNESNIGTCSRPATTSVRMEESDNGKDSLFIGGEDDYNMEEYATTDEEDDAEDEEELDGGDGDGSSSVDWDSDTKVGPDEQYIRNEPTGQQRGDMDYKSGDAGPYGIVTPTDTVLELLLGVCISLRREHPIDGRSSVRYQDLKTG
ncbi:hypothetical protein MGU_11382 [Metarhizium guizhouense ARSEF 977]|uniref:Uncharacterized protein n=1 Tax=Metarhizium guizhouense (strain ARSEF 977) TaxID=1276136 RepID=A0A0B4G3S7_METGA|nr:hypothetical protein MGU_11382 [Metarhizium guizhouense ARSEF 977]